MCRLRYFNHLLKSGLYSLSVCSEYTCKNKIMATREKNRERERMREREGEKEREKESSSTDEKRRSKKSQRRSKCPQKRTRNFCRFSSCVLSS